MENYNKLLEKAKEAYKNCATGAEKRRLESIFPELKESEDEKIAKELIRYLPYCDDIAKDTKEKWIAWLEKQGEQKSSWSEEDEIGYNDALFAIEKARLAAKDENDMGNLWFAENWLKSLKRSRAVKIEKEDNNNSISSEEIGKSTIRGIASSLINYLDNNRYEGAMNMSSIECEDLEKSILGSDWGKVYRYMQKKLEKQNEQKTTDKVKSKFNQGDWVIDKQGIVHQIANVIENMTNHTYGYDIVGGGYFNDKAEGVRLWTIEDAKDGDVLVTVDDKHPFIYKGCLDPNHPDFPVAYCGINSGGYFCNNVDNLDHWWTDVKVQPATKEQRDLLFTKMKEAGYEWNVDTKSLKKL